MSRGGTESAKEPTGDQRLRVQWSLRRQAGSHITGVCLCDAVFKPSASQSCRTLTAGGTTAAASTKPYEPSEPANADANGTAHSPHTHPYAFTMPSQPPMLPIVETVVGPQTLTMDGRSHARTHIQTRKPHGASADNTAAAGSMTTQHQPPETDNFGPGFSSDNAGDGPAQKFYAVRRGVVFSF